jgi:hypothetical protein
VLDLADTGQSRLADVIRGVRTFCTEQPFWGELQRVAETR